MPLLTKGKFCNTKRNILADVKIEKKEEPQQNIISNTPDNPTQPASQPTNEPKLTTLPELSFTKKKKLKKIFFKVD